MCDSPLFGGPGLSFHLSSVFFPEVILGSPGGRNLLFLSFRLLRSLTLCSRRDARSGPVYAFRRDAVGLMFRGLMEGEGGGGGGGGGHGSVLGFVSGIKQAL